MAAFVGRLLQGEARRRLPLLAFLLVLSPLWGQ